MEPNSTPSPSGTATAPAPADASGAPPTHGASAAASPSAPSSSAASSSPHVLSRQRILTAVNPLKIGKPGAGSANQLQVIPQYQGDIIQALLVRCSCGCELQLLLDYSAVRSEPTPSAPPAVAEKRVVGRAAS